MISQFVPSLKRTPYALRQELKKQIDDLLEADIITLSDSSNASSLILIKEKNNSYKLVCDYRKLNLKAQLEPSIIFLIY